MTEQRKNKTALGAAGARKSAEMPEFSEAFESADAPASAEVPATKPAAPILPKEPEVRTRKSEVKTRKDQMEERKKPSIKPLEDYVRDRNGEIKRDEEGDEMRYAAGEHRGVGFVSEGGVLFPNGYKFRGGHVMNGAVVLNRCPRCGGHQSIDEALTGECANRRAGPEKLPCGYSARAELEEIRL